MLVYGDLIAAGLEELESDPTTGLFSGRIYRNTTSGEVRVYSGSTWKTVVDKDTAQTLSAKTIDSSCTVSSPLSLPVIPPSKGGTGVANNDAATLSMSGNHSLTITTTAPTRLTLPTTGTVSTLSGQETLVNKVVSSTGETTGALKLPVGDNSAHRPTGTAAQLKGMIRYNDTEDVFEGYNEIGGWSAIGGGGTTDRIAQAGHGFVVGDVLYLNGSTYAKAIASAANTAEVVGVVSKVIDSGQFELTLSGEVSGLVNSSFTEGTLPPVGEALFLSSSVPGKLTISEPTVVGSVSLPVGVISEEASATGRKMYVAIKRGAVVGSSNVRSQVPLANNTTNTVQSVSEYDAGELTGWVSITATTPLRFYLSAQFSKNGAGNYNISYQVSGDTPPTGFLIQVTSAGVIQAVLPNITGFASASINYAINAPAVGATFPLAVDSQSIVLNTELANRNVLINGDMKIAQRGDTSISSGQSLYGGADRWRVSFTAYGTGSGTIRRAGSLGSYVQELQFTTGGLLGGVVAFAQRIEAANCLHLNGKTVTFSATLYQDTGSTINVAMGLSKPSALDNFSSIANISSQSLSLPSGERLRFSHTITLGSTDASNGLSVFVQMNVPNVSSKFVQIQDAQLEIGSIATPMERRSIGSELSLCQRYYQSASGGLLYRFNNYAATTATVQINCQFKQTMRSAPSVVIANYDVLDGTPVTINSGIISHVDGFYFGVTAPSGNYVDLNSYTASAEL